MGRRKRPRVPEESRKRIQRACDACRRVKEKCAGGPPCARCTRLGRTCDFADTYEKTHNSRHQDFESLHHGFLDPERIKIMEDIIRHFTKTTSLDKSTLMQLASSIEASSSTNMYHSNTRATGATDLSINNRDYSIDLISPTTAVYTGEQSHCHFSNTVQQKLKRDLQSSDLGQFPGMPQSVEVDRASRLHSETSIILKSALAAPPIEIANFLTDVFFQFAQTNYFYVDERSFRDKVGSFFSQSRALTPQDSSWVCTMLMVFAIGSQFAHLSPKQNMVNNMDVEIADFLSADDNAALCFYHAAKSLIPDIITIASIESVQAFLLLGIYTLPIDPAGLSYAYLGLAIKMAISNGMHRKSHVGMEARTIELRNRIFWSACTLEKRICVLHGRPVSITRSDVDTDLPSDLPALQSTNSINTLPNVLAMIKLTSMLEDARDRISWLKRSQKAARLSLLVSISKLKDNVDNYWSELPSTTFCKDLSINNFLFRFNVHLTLTYHLIQVFIGRSFIFESSETSDSASRTDTLSWIRIRDHLITNCIHSAREIIDLCQKLHDEVGLARASYTEFTTCRAALLVILAQQLQQNNDHLRAVLERGIKLMKHMALGIYSATAEKNSITAMETAIKRLDAYRNGDANQHSTGYENFRNWATLWREEGRQTMENSQSSSNSAGGDAAVGLENFNFSALSPLEDFAWDLFSPSFPVDTGFLYASESDQNDHQYD